jgi:hypothetical protein
LFFCRNSLTSTRQVLCQPIGSAGSSDSRLLEFYCACKTLDLIFILFRDLFFHYRNYTQQ